MTARHREEPGPGQESVWDYPRPPAVQPSAELVEVQLDGRTLAQTRASLRILETSHPPTYYLPRDSFGNGILVPVDGSTICEFKGRADYFDVVVDGVVVVPRVAWHYPEPGAQFIALIDHIAVMPGRLDCFVDEEKVRPQGGDFYGGWITSRVVGPFKGAPGTIGW